MGKSHNKNRNFLIVAICIFLLVQLAIHDYQDIIHIDTLSSSPFFENVSLIDMASGGLENWQILISNTSVSMLLPAVNLFQQAFHPTFSTFSENQQTLVIRC